MRLLSAILRLAVPIAALAGAAAAQAPTAPEIRAQWNGASVADEFGGAAARVGDVDGDGCDDLAVSAWGDDAAFVDAGV
ncbi:MAG TPA: hypothetical protein VEI02_05810, partial [Planctomycetota bacterium]|nr:hypothetical protein [Planctomycetota bacterium]